MAKRFTDTDKWRRPWFRDLPERAKIVWIHLCDLCDHAGIFILDFKLLSFEVGFKVDQSHLIQWFGGKIIQIDTDKLFIPSFFDFQYGDAKDTFSAKVSALKILRKYNLVDENNQIIKDSGGIVPAVSLESTSTSTSTGTGTGTSNINKKKVFDFEIIYKAYPRKIGKKKGIEKLKATVKDEKDFQLVLTAVNNYAAYCKKEKTEGRYIMHFSTFINQWQDWAQDETGSCEAFNQPENLAQSIAENLKGL